MAIKLYNPKTQAFVAFTAPVADLPLSELLLLNILVELQVQSVYMQQITGTVIDEPSTLRTDIVSETQ